MRVISGNAIRAAVSRLCLEANFKLRAEVVFGLKAAFRKEENKKAKRILGAIINNATIAHQERLAICQDTGMPCVFVELGQDVRIKGGLINAIHQGVERGYKEGSLRNSIVSDPLQRGAPGYVPAVIHTEIVPGSKLTLTVLPKGFGCENKARLRMMNPTVSLEEIKKFIVETVQAAGPDACPPYVVGVGIGGTADYAMLLAKKALLKKRAPRTQSFITRLEKELLRTINSLNIGPMGLGGKNTCLAVRILTYATHIAGLPVGVNISCHALRSATAVL